MTCLFKPNQENAIILSYFETILSFSTFIHLYSLHLHSCEEKEVHLCLLDPHKECHLRLFFFFLSFLGPHQKFSCQGLNLSYSCMPTPQPQQCQIWAMSVTHTTAHGYTRSLTHWARPGIKAASSWILIEFIISESQRNSFWCISASFKFRLKVMGVPPITGAQVPFFPIQHTQDLLIPFSY